MPPDPPLFNLATVNAALAGTPFAGQVHHFSSTSSTNTLAIEAAQSGSSTGVWLADQQTAGRGRGGHTWHSAPGDGLYVSILLRPRLQGTDTLKISLATAIAVQAAVAEATNVHIAIRWPNDLVDGPHGKKFGGILTETAMDAAGTLSYAVIGIGLNLNHTVMPQPLRDTAISLRMANGGQSVSREALLPPLLAALAREVGLAEAEAAVQLAPGTLAEKFSHASVFARNLPVHVEEDGGYTGITAGLDPSGLLRVRTEDGTLRIVRHGGVRALPQPS